MELSDFLHDLTTSTGIFDLNYSCFSIGQLKSKDWLIDKLMEIRNEHNIHLGIIFVLCGWYGILPSMLFLHFDDINRIRSFDIDPDCERVADQMNKKNSSNNWRFKAITQDINEINFEEHSWRCWSNSNNRMSYPITDVPSTIINTACEHTTNNWYNKVPSGKFIILQSNDSFKEEGHVNPVSSLEEFKSMYPMDIEYYSGSLQLPKSKRFMLIGVK